MKLQNAGLGTALLCLLGACASPDVGAAARALSGGMVTDDASVVSVATIRPTNFCSGTVVGAREVLTMRFCVLDDLAAPEGPIVGPDLVDVASGPSIADATPFTVEAIFESGTTMSDVVILRTTELLPGRALAPSATVPAVDDSLRILGFGQAESGSSGTRREGTAIVVSVATDAPTFVSNGPSHPCSGDGGGPAIDESGALVGMPYFGSGSCGMGVDTWRRVEDLVTFIADNTTEQMWDAGTPDGSVPDAAEDTSTGTDGGTDDGSATVDASTPGGSDGGCDCDATSEAPMRTPVTLAALLFAFILRRRGLREKGPRRGTRR